MRYGKVYYYDRMGHRQCNGPTVSKDDDIFLKNLIRAPQSGNIRFGESSSFGFSSGANTNAAAFHQDYPFRSNFFALDEAETDFAEGGASQHKSGEELTQNIEAFDKFVEPSAVELDYLPSYDNIVAKSAVGIFDTFVSPMNFRNNLEKLFDNNFNDNNKNNDTNDNNNSFINNSNNNNNDNNNNFSPSLAPPRDKERRSDCDNMSYRQAFELVQPNNDNDFNDPHPKAIVPIMSPLNSLHSVSNDMEKELLSHELERITLNDSRIFNAAGPKNLISSARPLPMADVDPDWVDIERSLKQLGEFDLSSLCSQCLAEEKNKKECGRSSNLQKKLVNHMDEINYSTILKKESFDIPQAERISEFPKLEGMTDEQLKEKEKLEKLQYRQELLADIEHRKEEQQFNEEKRKQAENLANSLDAKLFAEERDREKALKLLEQKKHYDELQEQIKVRDASKRREDAALEWWERRPLHSEALTHQAGEEDHLLGQLRRNIALKESIDVLEDFKKTQRDIDEETRSIKHHNKEIVNRDIQEQAKLFQSGGKRRRRMSQNPEVFRAWEEAHLRNDRRYRVLQDYESTATRPSHFREFHEPEMGEKHCRRCRRVIGRKKFIQFNI